MKITIIGNSVALRVRPSEVPSKNKNYTFILQESFGQKAVVENKALGATTISNWLKMSDYIINSFPNIYIINIGVVDSTIREVPLWLYRLSNRKIDNYLTKIFKGFYRGPIAVMRPFLSKIRGSRPWISYNKFEDSFDQLVQLILKETNAQIITLPINIANDRIEKQLPGSRKNHAKYNQVMKDITEQHKQTFLDLTDLTSEDHYPDGVHFNSKGHQVVAEKLTSILKEKIN